MTAIDILIHQVVHDDDQSSDWFISIDGETLLRMATFGEAADLALAWAASTSGKIYRQDVNGQPELYTP